jgi:GTP-sensing pleiotropic transcriptional regulator CodY
MDPSIWGACLWKALHFIAIGYPKDPTFQDVTAYKEFFENLWKVLPCNSCSVNYRRHLKEIPLENYLLNNHKLFEWTFLIHNKVNEELNKPLMKWSDAVAYYRSILYGSKSINNENTTNTLLVIVLIVAVGFGIYYFMKQKTQTV